MSPDLEASQGRQLGQGTAPALAGDESRRATQDAALRASARLPTARILLSRTRLKLEAYEPIVANHPHIVTGLDHIRITWLARPQSHPRVVTVGPVRANCLSPAPHHPIFSPSGAKLAGLCCAKHSTRCSPGGQ